VVSVDPVAGLPGGYPVVALRGTLDISGSADAVSAIVALTALGQVVIVDFSPVDFMDCSERRTP
jgi:anti-anti-sigma regulatory factor